MCCEIFDAEFFECTGDEAADGIDPHPEGEVGLAILTTRIGKENALRDRLSTQDGYAGKVLTIHHDHAHDVATIGALEGLAGTLASSRTEGDGSRSDDVVVLEAPSVGLVDPGIAKELGSKEVADLDH